MTLANVLAVPQSYFAHRVFVFRSEGSVIRELPRYAFVHAFMVLVNLGMLPIVVNLSPLGPLGGQAAFVVFLVVASYGVHSRVTFASR